MKRNRTIAHSAMPIAAPTTMPAIAPVPIPALAWCEATGTEVALVDVEGAGGTAAASDHVDVVYLSSSNTASCRFLNVRVCEPGARPLAQYLRVTPSQD
jgi:hypothetical protein